jgi:hypothetical protein
MPHHVMNQVEPHGCLCAVVYGVFPYFFLDDLHGTGPGRDREDSCNVDQMQCEQQHGYVERYNARSPPVRCGNLTHHAA